MHHLLPPRQANAAQHVEGGGRVPRAVQVTIMRSFKSFNLSELEVRKNSTLQSQFLDFVQIFGVQKTRI